MRVSAQVVIVTKPLQIQRQTPLYTKRKNF